MYYTMKLTALPQLLRQFRQKHRLSINKLSKLSGISRRTLTRIEAGFYSFHGPRVTGHESPAVRSPKSVGGPPAVRSPKSIGGPPAVRSPKSIGGPPAVRSSKSVGGRHLSPRIAYRLSQLLLPPDQARQTVHGQADPFDLIKEVLDPYPAFLFHDFRALSERSRSVAKTPPVPSGAEGRFLRGGDPERSRGAADPFAEFAPDYSGAFFRLILMPERNLAQRLHAFRLQHGLTLKDTAYLLDLSLSHLHALETGQRSPSPRTRFKLLRLLTLPFPNRDSSEEVFGLPRQRRGTRSYRQQHLDALKALLTIPPPEPIELTDDSDRLHHLRYLWLTSTDSTRHLAARLGISQPHLIRLLRGDRRPSRSLRQRLELLTAPPCLS